MTLAIDVQIATDDSNIPSTSDMQKWVAAALQHADGMADADVELAVRIVDVDEIRSLNKTFRKQDKPTNVLSFPAGDMDGIPGDSTRLLGDVVVCAPVIAAEAQKQGKELADHWCHMLVHGSLHLLGFDHGTDAEAAEMEGLEAKILLTQNVTDPYAGT